MTYLTHITYISHMTCITYIIYINHNHISFVDYKNAHFIKS